MDIYALRVWTRLCRSLSDAGRFPALNDGHAPTVLLASKNPHYIPVNTLLAFRGLEQRSCPALCCLITEIRLDRRLEFDLRFGEVTYHH